MDEISIFSSKPMLLGESPLWEPRERSLYWIDIDGRAVHGKSIDGGAEKSWALPSEPGCIVRSRKGLVVAMRTGVFELDTTHGSLNKLADPPFDPGVQRFNDGKADSLGRLWVGTIHEPRDAPRATLYCFDDTGVQDQHIPVTVSNGLAFSPDGRTVYHADTTAHAIRAWEFDADARRLSGSRTFARFNSVRGPEYGGRPDGATVDSEGAYWVAMYEGGRLLRLAPDGLLLQEIRLPVVCPTMVSFGGDDLRTLFVTSVSGKRSASELSTHPLSGHVLSMRVPVPGLVEPLCRLGAPV